ncbi:hypothetical protein [Streptomyces aidingensis]|uniref:hypothetical protein n=1 Tax=Streptomyces aidingensis TaxID=910347 RepID=UPI001FE44BD4|nr:hypothetical protein [Streptomyces aidingensis]
MHVLLSALQGRNGRMGELGTALVAAGAAVFVGLTTGLLAFRAGMRQADAARHSGDRQADAVLETVRITIEEQRTVRVLELRRQTYVRFVETLEAFLLSRRTGTDGRAEDRAELHRAYAAVLLEGPEEVSTAARAAIDSLRGRPPGEDGHHARSRFIETARRALGIAGGPPV